MALTYQPFGEVPAVNELARELHTNVSNGERLVSGLAALRFLAAGVAHRGVFRWSLLFLGGMLLLRSFTGRCPIYEVLEIDTRHPATPTTQDIAARAREIWQKEGEPEGKAEEHWRRAQSELTPAPIA